MVDKVSEFDRKLGKDKFFSKSGEQPSDIDNEIYEAIKPIKNVLKGFKNRSIFKWFDKMAEADLKKECLSCKKEFVPKNKGKTFCD